MKNLVFLLLTSFIYFSCADGEEQVEQDKKEVEKSNLQPLMNMYGNDSIDAQGNIVYTEVESNNVKENKKPEEDLGYSLGVRPAHAIPNQYGEDSIDAEGNYVYPPRDTIWDEE